MVSFLSNVTTNDSNTVYALLKLISDPAATKQHLDELLAAKATLDAQAATLAANKADLDRQKSDLDADRSDIAAARAQLNTDQAKLASDRQQLEADRAAHEQRVKRLQAAWGTGD